MIIWIGFTGGHGGDGFANLLEHAAQARTIDGVVEWRIHRYVNDKVKFFAPTLQNTALRVNTVDLLNDRQLEIANSDTEYLIVTSHDTRFQTILSPAVLPDNKNIKVLLLSKNYNMARYNYLTKSLEAFDNADLHTLGDNYRQPVTPQADIVVDIDTVVNSWEYTKQVTQSIGLELTHEDFDHYRKIVTGEFVYCSPGIERYKSVVGADNMVGYRKLN